MNPNKRKNQRVKAFTVAVIVFMVLIILDRMDTMPMDLTHFQWKNRLLFLYAPDGDDPVFKKWHSDIDAQKAEVEDRDLVVFEVLERGQSRMNMETLNPKTVNSLRKRFAVPRGVFRVILIGKDSGVKFEGDNQADLKKIFDLIDAMPMRQNEMRQKKQQS
jgi:hypothetical protein